jgi:preprotein translocase subunit SecF
MNIIKKKNLFFLISGLVIIPGVISLVLFGLKFSIDFTGGTKLEISAKNPDKGKIEKILQDKKVEIHTINISGNTDVLIRLGNIEPNKKNEIVNELKKVYPEVEEKNYETVGPTIGKETKINAIKAVVIASIAITLYIAFAFRKVSQPVASWKYGVSAIIALLHDVIIVIGAFSIFGVLFNVEVDALFITALLTVMGFSVHDTIVVFDRIRENLRKNYNQSFEVIVNNSLLETINRSVNTSLTVVIVLFSLLLFGGESIRWFVVALLIGIVSGTYSSIFNASPLLIVWYELERKKKQK